MPQVGFEPTIPAFKRAKTVHALDRAAIVIGWVCMQITSITSLGIQSAMLKEESTLRPFILTKFYLTLSFGDITARVSMIAHLPIVLYS
jgi:hypothetical protein